MSIEPDGEYFNIIKLEKYFVETGQWLDITSVKSEKLTNYVSDLVNQEYSKYRSELTL